MRRKKHRLNTPNRQLTRLMAGASITLFTSILLIAYLSPLLYMTSTSLKDKGQISHPQSPIWPARAASYTYEGEDYDIYQVPLDDGTVSWALIKPGRQESQFIDPQHPELGPINWEGQWRQLDPAWQMDPQWNNYVEVWNIPSQDFTFFRWIFNTFAIAGLGIIGTLLSCICVAYGFSRFRIPGKSALFMILISTIFLPVSVTTVPTYAFFARIGWVGTWLPLVIPHFFANAYNVFWLRQYFMTIPRAMDEAAMIDGAGPFRILFSVILPQAKPAIVTVTLMHMVFAWKDFYGPLIYLSTKPAMQPISVGIQQFNALYGAQPQLVQAAALMGLAIPVLLFFIAQRVFMQGMVFTGVEK